MRLLVHALIFLFATNVFALETDGILWNQFFWQGPKAWKVRPSVEIQQRLGDHFKKIEHLLYRPAVVYAPDAQMSFWLGYGWTPTFDVPSAKFDSEQRLWQQFSYTFEFESKASLMFRTRLEERWIKGATDIGLRARELVRFHQPLSEPFQLVVWDELFWQINGVSNAVIAGFNQNRVLVGPYIKAHENIFIEVGYLTILTRRPEPAGYKWSNGVLLALYTSI